MYSSPLIKTPLAFFVKLLLQLVQMKQWKNPLRLVILCCLFLSVFLLRNNEYLKESEPENENPARESEHEAKYTRERLLHEFKMLRNPVTGKIPANIHDIELKTARNIPSRNSTWDIRVSRNENNADAQASNTYIPIGPDNIAGRSRTLAFDR